MNDHDQLDALLAERAARTALPLPESMRERVLAATHEALVAEATAIRSWRAGVFVAAAALFALNVALVAGESLGAGLSRRTHISSTTTPTIWSARRSSIHFTPDADRRPDHDARTSVD